MPCTPQRLPAVDRQERGARRGQGTCQVRALPQGLRHPHDTRCNEHRVCRRAEQHYAAHVLATQALAKHECVLRTDRDDEPQAQGRALDAHRENWNLTFIGAVKQMGVRESSHSRAPPDDRGRFAAERLQPKVTNWRCRPIWNGPTLRLHGRQCAGACFFSTAAVYAALNFSLG